MGTFLVRGPLSAEGGSASGGNYGSKVYYRIHCPPKAETTGVKLFKIQDVRFMILMGAEGLGGQVCEPPRDYARGCVRELKNSTFLRRKSARDAISFAPRYFSLRCLSLPLCLLLCRRRGEVSPHRQETLPAQGFPVFCLLRERSFSAGRSPPSFGRKRVRLFLLMR